MGDGLDTRGAAGAGEPPSPRGVATLDELTGRLRELRAWAGNPSFSRLVRDIAALRARRGLPARERSPGRITVFECFRPGRRRVDVELLVDIAAVLGVGGPELGEWRRAHRIVSIAGSAPEPVGDRFPPGWPGSQARTVARLVAAVRAAGPGQVVNLTGSVGIGKSAVLARMAVDAVRVDLAFEDGDLAAALGEDEDRLVVVDHVDSVSALAALSRALGRVDRRAPVVVASRRALPARAHVPSELITGTVVVPVEAWPDEEIGDLADRCGVGAPDRRAAIIRWAGGIPLLAEYLCRAVHRGVPVDLPGPLADLAAAEVWRRLRNELPPEAEPRALRTLASYGQADQELLSDAEAAGLVELSLVDWEAEGLAVREPYRTLFDHAHRWRTPLAHGRSVVKAVAHNREVIASSPDVERQVRRAEQTLWLTGDPTIRATLFPNRDVRTAVRASTEADGDEILRLLHNWARRADLDVRRSERIMSPWLAAQPGGFRVAVDRDGAIAGTISSLPLAADTHDLVEPLLQAHTSELVAVGGVLIGMTMSRDRQSQAALMLDVLLGGVRAGHMVVATTWPEYQALVDRLGFTYQGDSHDDVFRCGRPVQVHSHGFEPGELPTWLDRLTGLGVPAGDFGDLVWLTDQVRWALRHWHEPTSLAGSALLASPATPTAAALRARLREVIERLAADRDPRRAEAGRVLELRYLARRAADRVEREAGLSRATYYRRLRLGLTAVARTLLTTR